MTTLCALALAALPAAAQVDPEPPAPEPAQDRPESRRFFDGVGAMIGDKAILHSKVEADVRAWVDKERASGRIVTEEARQRRYSVVLRELLDEESYVQGALTGGQLTPGEFQERLDKLIDRYRQEQIEKYGSVTRWTEELGALGRTWGSLREEKRRELLEIQSRAEIFRRVRGRVALLVTPRKMREFYDENIDYFRAPGSAEVAVVVLSASGDAAADAQRARAVASQWREKPEATADEIATANEGRSTRFDGITADSDRAPFLIEFATGAAVGDVGEPLQVGSNLWILKLVAKTEARSAEFDDPEVQRLIVNQLRDNYLRKLELELRQRHAEGVNRFIGMPARR